MQLTRSLASLALLGVIGCRTGHEPNPCDSDLHIAVEGGATIRFQWNSGCDGEPETYRERDREIDLARRLLIHPSQSP